MVIAVRIIATELISVKADILCEELESRFGSLGIHMRMQSKAIEG